LKTKDVQDNPADTWPPPILDREVAASADNQDQKFQVGQMAALSVLTGVILWPVCLVTGLVLYGTGLLSYFNDKLLDVIVPCFYYGGPVLEMAGIVLGTYGQSTLTGRTSRAFGVTILLGMVTFMIVFPKL